MIDQARLDAIHLSPNPFAQKLVASCFLFPNFRLARRKTEIVVENAERLPRQGGAVFVMNHTDRYNYWPLQYWLWRSGHGHVATWVKGKYYEKAAMGWFMDKTGNIPIPSKGYVLSKDFALAMSRSPTEPEYNALKAFADGREPRDGAIAKGGLGVREFLDRNADYAADLERRFRGMMERTVEINREALRDGLNILVFPQGTRSVRLTRGHTGAAQIILDTRSPVIPIGCSGSDHCYPGNSPFSRGGRIVYRVGEPLTHESALRPFRIEEPFVPFTESARPHEARFRGVTDLLMDRINELVDPEYRYDPAAALTRGAERFL